MSNSNAAELSAAGDLESVGTPFTPKPKVAAAEIGSCHSVLAAGTEPVNRCEQTLRAAT